MVHTDDQVQVLRNGGKVEDISSANVNDFVDLNFSCRFFINTRNKMGGF